MIGLEEGVDAGVDDCSTHARGTVLSRLTVSEPYRLVTCMQSYPSHDGR